MRLCVWSKTCYMNDLNPSVCLAADRITEWDKIILALGYTIRAI